MADAARDAIKDGKSVDQFRAFVLDELAKKNLKPVSQETGELGLSEKEAKQFSFIRAINAQANPGDRQAFEAAGFEREVSEAFAKLTKRQPQGIFVPPEVLQRDLVVGTPTTQDQFVGLEVRWRM